MTSVRFVLAIDSMCLWSSMEHRGVRLRLAIPETGQGSMIVRVDPWTTPMTGDSPERQVPDAAPPRSGKGRLNSLSSAMIDEVFAPGMTAMAAPVLRRCEAIGVISIAGPRIRLTAARMQALAPALLAATAELGPMSRA